ncbi:unnamed protein product [Urochloa decumbens]|uniref:Uncharacterized protein n=1 Tax=Urochloa decumbens TaxID=240449 RepID=A0ABC9AVF4_9POAL
MELPAEVWVPCNFQMSNYWSMEPEVWVPGLPVEYQQYAATEIIGSSLQFPRHGIEDLIEKAPDQELEVDLQDMDVKINKNPIREFEAAAQEFKVDMDLMKMKIHRYPPSLRGFGEWYSVPRMVTMGPYHHARSLEEVYGAVVSATHDARRLYDKDFMEGISDNDFQTMMFFDACFLVQYMLWCTHGATEMEVSLRNFFEFNRKTSFLIGDTICKTARFSGKKPVVLDESYEPPHLPGLLRFYTVGRSNPKLHTRAKLESISVSVSAIELAEIGITLTAKQTTELIHMGLNKRGALTAKLFLAPLSLDDERASFLINMAALELCTTPKFLEAEDEDSAVCSYLLLLSMLVHREEDVQELRTKHLLQGGAGLINKDALDFFTSLQSLPLRGLCYVRVMVEIEKYKVSRRVRTKVHAFLYKNKKTIFTVFSVISVLVSILGTLVSLKARSKI